DVLAANPTRNTATRPSHAEKRGKGPGEPQRSNSIAPAEQLGLSEYDWCGDIYQLSESCTSDLSNNLH
ncbi:MAG: hypothetical protein MJA30_17805, partial [Cytophagales bacterium]|nr:hypothetical protein [Cytophagales bacterium]